MHVKKIATEKAVKKYLFYLLQFFLKKYKAVDYALINADTTSIYNFLIHKNSGDTLVNQVKITVLNNPQKNFITKYNTTSHYIIKNIHPVNPFITLKTLDSIIDISKKNNNKAKIQ